MPQKTSRARFDKLAELCHPQVAQRLARAPPPDLLAQVRARAARHPSRLLAKALALYARRWSIERMYFDLKVVLNLNRVYAANPNAVAMQVT